MSALAGDCTRVVNRGFCETCHAVVPVEHVVRGNYVYLTRDCPKCGHGETLISRDAKAYFEKRELMGYTGETQKTCSLNCADCRHGVSPTYVLVDVTNRCNMNCPICLANIQSMGFEFHPPLEYFERIFDHLATLKPAPNVQLFGGEPTCREDLIRIIRLARKRGLHVRLITNGIRFANEEYCKKVLSTRPTLLLGLDGVNPEIQRKLRKNPGSLKQKLKAIENIEKYSRSKICIMVTAAKGVSEQLMPDLMKFCYEKRNLISRMMTLPLQATAGPETVGMESSTVEDVEHLMEHCFPGLEYIPVGALRQMKTLMSYFGQNVTVGGPHPNCECLALMVADSTVGAYQPVSHYLKVSYKQLTKDLIAWDKQMEPKLERSLLGRLLGKKTYLGVALACWLASRVKIGKLIGPHPVRSLLGLAWAKLTSGGKLAKLFQQHTAYQGILEVIILPFEEPGCLESARLAECPTAFACENIETGEPMLVPFCSYFIYKNDILRKSTERWGIKADAKRAEQEQPTAEPATTAVSG